MTTALRPDALRRVERLGRIWEDRPGVLGWLTTTDHKRIGLLYLFTSLAFFAAGGTEALLIRTQLIVPNGSTLSPAAFNTTMTMHGVTMIFLFVIPISTGAFGNYLVPLMIGARDMAFPRLNAFSYWIFGHPEVYIIILPAFGIATSIIPTFTRRRMVAFPMVALAEILVAFIGFGVWAHHMFSVGLSTITTVYFAAASMIVVIPSAIQLFAWLTTLVTGRPILK